MTGGAGESFSLRLRPTVGARSFLTSYFFINLKMYWPVLGVMLAVCGSAVSHTMHLGKCPVVEPMPGFEMKQVGR